jgi:hypothetical protein
MLMLILKTGEPRWTALAVESWRVPAEESAYFFFFFFGFFFFFFGLDVGTLSSSSTSSTVAF